MEVVGCFLIRGWCTGLQAGVGIAERPGSEDPGSGKARATHLLSQLHTIFTLDSLVEIPLGFMRWFGGFSITQHLNSFPKNTF